MEVIPSESRDVNLYMWFIDLKDDHPALTVNWYIALLKYGPILVV